MSKLFRNGNLKMIGIMLTVLLLVVNLLMNVWGSNSSRIDRLESKVDGKDGLIANVAEINANIINIATDIGEIKTEIKELK